MKTGLTRLRCQRFTDESDLEVISDETNVKREKATTDEN
jgi:hypothetical protein